MFYKQNDKVSTEVEILDLEMRKERLEKIKIRSSIEVAQSKKCFEGFKCLKVKF